MIHDAEATDWPLSKGGFLRPIQKTLRRQVLSKQEVETLQKRASQSRRGVSERDGLGRGEASEASQNAPSQAAETGDEETQSSLSEFLVVEETAAATTFAWSESTPLRIEMLGVAEAQDEALLSSRLPANPSTDARRVGSLSKRVSLSKQRLRKRLCFLPLFGRALEDWNNRECLSVNWF